MVSIPMVRLESTLWPTHIHTKPWGLPMPLPVYLVMARGDPHTPRAPFPAYIGHPSIPAENQLHSQAGSQRHLWLRHSGGGNSRLWRKSFTRSYFSEI